LKQLQEARTVMMETAIMEDTDSETFYAREAEARELWTAVLITNNLR
jgi:hypothetical protein